MADAGAGPGAAARQAKDDLENRRSVVGALAGLAALAGREDPPDQELIKAVPAIAESAKEGGEKEPGEWAQALAALAAISNAVRGAKEAAVRHGAATSAVAAMGQKQDEQARRNGAGAAKAMAENGAGEVLKALEQAEAPRVAAEVTTEWAAGEGKGSEEGVEAACALAAEGLKSAETDRALAEAVAKGQEEPARLRALMGIAMLANRESMREELKGNEGSLKRICEISKKAADQDERAIADDLLHSLASDDSMHPSLHHAVQSADV